LAVVSESSRSIGSRSISHGADQILSSGKSIAVAALRQL